MRIQRAPLRTLGRLQRRATFLVILAASVLVSATPAQLRAAPDARPFPIDLERATIGQLQQALAARTITSEELVGAYLQRIRALNSTGPSLNAVRVLNPDAEKDARQLDRERERGKLRGPLHGIPVLIKDNIDLGGLPTTAGSLALENSFPAGDAFLVGRLRAAGAIVLGKTNLTEFANFTTAGMPSGYSSLGGQVLNPYDVSQTPSGSSSGSGVAAATGLAAVTIGTETSGSILSPAVANSLVGVKPTVGLVSRSGIVPIAASQDTAGPMARTVTDAATALSALTGVDPADPATAASAGVVGTDYTRTLSTDALRGVRIAVASTASGTQGEVFTEALDVLRAQGATLVNVSLNTAGLPAGILDYEFKRDLNAYLATLPAGAPMRTLDDVVRFNEANAARGTIKFGQTQLVTSNNIDIDDPATKAAYEADRDAGIAGARQRIDAVLRDNDAAAIVFLGSGSAAIGARAQYPSVAMPIGYDPANGRPVGITFLGTAFSEARLLSLAYDYEQASLKREPPSVVNPSLFRCSALTRAPRSCAP